MDSWISLDKNKHYGIGGSKLYAENGILTDTADDVAQTYTMFYPNGNKKQKPEAMFLSPIMKTGHSITDNIQRIISAIVINITKENFIRALIQEKTEMK